MGCAERKEKRSRYHQNPREYRFHFRFDHIIVDIGGAQLNIEGAKALLKRYKITRM